MTRPLGVPEAVDPQASLGWVPGAGRYVRRDQPRPSSRLPRKVTAVAGRVLVDLADQRVLALGVQERRRTAARARSATPPRRGRAARRPRRTRFRVVANIGGSSELMVTGTPAATRAGSGCRRATAPTGCGRWTSGRPRAAMPRSARYAISSRVVRGGDAVPDPLGAEVGSASQMVCGPVDSPACGTLCSPAARACGEVRRELRARHADLRAAQTEADQPVRALAQRDVEGPLGGRRGPPRRGCRSTSAATMPWSASARRGRPRWPRRTPRRRCPG